MPFYDYICKRCGHVFTQMRTIAQRDNGQCPQCESADVERKISACFVGGCSTSASSGSSSTGGGFGGFS